MTLQQLNSREGFDDSAGGRERGKFRGSAAPHKTTVAVVNDDGTLIAEGVEEVLNEILLYQKAMVQALVWLANGEPSFTVDDVLTAVS